MENTLISKTSSVLYQNRFCDQENFDLIITGFSVENTYLRSIYKVNGPSFVNVATLISDSNYIEESLTSGSNIWLTCSQNIKHKTFETYKISSRSSDLNKNLIQLPGLRNYYCICSFMKNIYVFGGNINGMSSNTCLKYNTRSNIWKYITNLNNSRRHMACTVFESKVVVSGGISSWKGVLKSVEAYNHHENKWTHLPDMINERKGHGSVSMGNKMFVIGGNWNMNCEVFDSISRKFTFIKKIEVVDINCFSVVGIGNVIFAFPKHYSSTNKSVQVYDVLNDQWRVKEVDLFENIFVDSCSKLPVV